MPSDFDLLGWLWTFAIFGIVAAAVCAAGAGGLLVWFVAHCLQFV